MTREEIAEHFNTSETTISRNKKRLVDRLSAVLFSDDVIYELFV
jgi:DNA-directed RNA polymerase specialized sigma subunit